MRILVLLAFFISGFTSLVLETLWVRMLTLVFGGTTLAIVTVLTAFMGGLALGSLISGRFAERIRYPVTLYGILEICIAAYALVLPFFIGHLPTIYHWLPPDWPFFITAWIRFVLCVGLLIIPTTLMGATLPLLSHFFVRRRSLIGFDVGLLYSTNTFGAVVGTFTGGFFLLPLWGHSITLWSVTGFLSCIAVGMILLGRRYPQDEYSLDETEQTEQDDIADFAKEECSTSMEPAKMQRITLVCIAVTGATAMICQVIWSRTLAMVIGSSTYAFTLILTLFLIGLAGGALWGSWAARRSWDVTTSWASFLIGTGITIALGSFFMDRLPLLFISLVYGLPKHTSPMMLFALKACIASVPIILPTFLMGAFFPLALALYTQNQGSVGRSVGQLYAANTLGSIVGSGATGFILIPLIGLRGCLALCTTLYFVCAVWLIFQKASEKKLIFAIIGIVGCVGVWSLPSWHTGRMSLGMFRLSIIRHSSSFKELTEPGRVLFYKEGISATVAVEGNREYRALKVNGKTDASNVGDRSTQIGVSFLPMLLHPDPKDVAIIGWGSGMSVGAALKFPAQRVTAVELEPAVVAASYLFRPWNYSPQKDKRLRLYYNDGRNYLATTQEKFDTIVSVPSNPWMAGVANLFTQDYFRITSQRLKPGGIFCQWVQIYELSTRNIFTILRSIHSVYPYVRLFEIELDSYDLILMASHQPIRLDMKEIQKRLQKKRFRTLRKDMKLHSAYDFLPRFLVGEKELSVLFSKYAKEVPINTDTHNILEFTAPLDLVTQSNSNAGELFHKKLAQHGRNFSVYAQPKAAHSSLKVATFWKQSILAHLRYGSIARAEKLFKRHQVTLQKHPSYAETKRLVRLMKGKEAPPPLPAPPDPRGSSKTWIKLYKQLDQARIAYDKDKDEKCIQLLAMAETTKAFTREYPHVLFYLGACSRFSDDYQNAMRYFQRFIKHPLARKPHVKPQ